MGSPLLHRLRLKLEASKTRRRASASDPPAGATSPPPSSSWKVMFRRSGSTRFQQRNRSHSEKLEAASPEFAGSSPPPPSPSRRATIGKVTAPWRRHSTSEPPAALPVVNESGANRDLEDSGEELKSKKKKKQSLVTDAMHRELARMILLA